MTTLNEAMAGAAAVLDYLKAQGGSAAAPAAPAAPAVPEGKVWMPVTGHILNQPDPARQSYGGYTDDNLLAAGGTPDKGGYMNGSIACHQFDAARGLPDGTAATTPAMWPEVLDRWCNIAAYSTPEENAARAEEAAKVQAQWDASRAAGNAARQGQPSDRKVHLGAAGTVPPAPDTGSTEEI